MPCSTPRCVIFLLYICFKRTIDIDAARSRRTRRRRNKRNAWSITEWEPCCQNTAGEASSLHEPGITQQQLIPSSFPYTGSLSVFYWDNKTAPMPQKAQLLIPTWIFSVSSTPRRWSELTGDSQAPSSLKSSRRHFPRLCHGVRHPFNESAARWQESKRAFSTTPERALRVTATLWMEQNAASARRSTTRRQTGSVLCFYSASLVRAAYLENSTEATVKQFNCLFGGFSAMHFSKNAGKMQLPFNLFIDFYASISFKLTACSDFFWGGGLG